MSAAKKLDEQINSYLSHLNIKQKKAVLNVVEIFAGEHGNIEEKNAHEIEMDRRQAEYESGKAKVITWEQLKTGVRAAYKAKTKKKR